MPPTTENIQIEYVDLDATPADSAALSGDERARADGFRFAEHRRRFIASRVALRRCLAAHTGVAPRALNFAIDTYGKPRLTNGPAGLDFNLSHSAGHALIAIAMDARVGIDIEVMRPVPDRLTLSQRFFAPGECAALRERADGADLAFLRCWTRKEAYIKALGLGLTHPLDAFEVSLDDPPRLLSDRTDANAPQCWTLRDVSQLPMYVAAVAISHPL